MRIILLKMLLLILQYYRIIAIGIAVLFNIFIGIGIFEAVACSRIHIASTFYTFC